MPSINVAVSLQSVGYYFEGPMALKRHIYGNQRGKAEAMLKWLRSVKKDDAKPAAKSNKLPKYLVFDPTVTGLTAAVALVEARLVAALAAIP